MYSRTVICNCSHSRMLHFVNALILLSTLVLGHVIDVLFKLGEMLLLFINLGFEQ